MSVELRQIWIYTCNSCGLEEPPDEDKKVTSWPKNWVPVEPSGKPTKHYCAVCAPKIILKYTDQPLPPPAHKIVERLMNNYDMAVENLEGPWNINGRLSRGKVETIAREVIELELKP